MGLKPHLTYAATIFLLRPIWDGLEFFEIKEAINHFLSQPILNSAIRLSWILSYVFSLILKMKIITLEELFDQKTCSSATLVLTTNESKSAIVREALLQCFYLRIRYIRSTNPPHKYICHD